MDIGIVARRTSLAASAIRYYEDGGLLGPVPRGDNGRRRYTPAHLERLVFIQNCRETGMSLDAVAELLRLTGGTRQPCPEAKEIVDGHVGRLRQQLAQMQDFLAKLEDLSAACAPDRCGARSSECTIFSGLGGAGC